MKKTTKKLTLSKTTVRNLDEKNLQSIAGGPVYALGGGGYRTVLNCSLGLVCSGECNLA